VEAVVLLDTRENCIKNSGKDMEEVYAEKSPEVIPLLIGDFGTLNLDQLRDIVEFCLKRAGWGEISPSTAMLVLEGQACLRPAWQSAP
jgi:hypothetical protein